MDELSLLRNLDPDTPGPSPAETAAALARLLAVIDAQPSASRPAVSPGRLPFRERFASPRFWAPVAAAAAVAALAITGAVIGAHAVPATRRPAPGPASAALPSLADGLPAYFLERSLDQSPRETVVRVVATATGKVAATATLPGYVDTIAASRGAFFAAVSKDNLTRFYEIRLNDSRTATTVTLLPIRPDTAPPWFMAVSPDGAELAYSTQVMRGTFRVDHSLVADDEVQNLVVASTAGGSQREWLTPPQDSWGSMGDMAWLADGRTLAFEWITNELTPGAVSLRVLDTTAPGSDLMASRVVLPSAYVDRLFVQGTLSPDGQVVVGSASGSAASRAPAGSMIAFSTATSQVTVLYRVSHPDNGCGGLPPLWISNTGSELLVICYRFNPPTANLPPNVVLIDHGHATVLPWLSGIAVRTWVTAFPPSPSAVHEVVTDVVARGASGSSLSGWEITLIIIVSLVLTAGVTIVYLTHRPGP
jgi:hypothetical protein